MDEIGCYNAQILQINTIDHQKLWKATEDQEKDEMECAIYGNVNDDFCEICMEPLHTQNRQLCNYCTTFHCKNCVGYLFGLDKFKRYICKSCFKKSKYDMAVELFLIKIYDALMHDTLKDVAFELLATIEELKRLDNRPMAAENDRTSCIYEECFETYSLLSDVDLDYHERECFFGIFHCRRINSLHCDYEGSLDDFVEHVQSQHYATIWRRSCFERFFKLEEFGSGGGTMYDVLALQDKKRIFIFRTFYDQYGKGFLFDIKLLGPHRCARKYIYKIELSQGKRQTMRKGICGNHLNGDSRSYRRKNRIIFTPFELECFENAHPICLRLKITNTEKDEEVWE